MTQQEAEKVLRKDLELSKKIKPKIDAIDAFLQQADKVLEACNYYFTTCIKYLHAPDDGGKNAPIPAFKGTNSHEANRAVQILNELMREAKPFLLNKIAFKDTYDVCCKNITVFLEKRMKLMIKITPKSTTAPIILDAATIKDIIANKDKVPTYIKQLDTMISSIANFEQRIKNIKNKIQILKGVN